MIVARLHRIGIFSQFSPSLRDSRHFCGNNEIARKILDVRFCNAWRVRCVEMQHFCSSSTPDTRDEKSEVTKRKEKVKPSWKGYKEFVRPPHSRLPAEGKEYLTEDMLMESVKYKQPVMTFEQKVKETSKTMWYTTVMFAGFASLIVLGLTFFTEMFGQNSVNRKYGEVAKIIKADTRIQDMLGGSKLSVYGEQSPRGWRRHVLSTQFYNEGNLYLRMRFYVKGDYRTATVNVEMKANEKGIFDKYSYIIVEADGYPPRTVEIDVDSL